MTTSETPDKLKAMGLFLKEGVFHAIIQFPGFCVEVALHGICDLEEALQALERIAPLSNPA